MHLAKALNSAFANYFHLSHRDQVKMKQNISCAKCANEIAKQERIRYTTWNMCAPVETIPHLKMCCTHHLLPDIEEWSNTKKHINESNQCKADENCLKWSQYMMHDCCCFCIKPQYKPNLIAFFTNRDTFYCVCNDIFRLAMKIEFTLW